jgi:1-deoxy-D-xylulose-5-phosphate reductoisomerase
MKLTILGATGSIGVSTLDVVARHPDRFQVVALTGHSQVEVLAAQCKRFRPAYAVVGGAAEAGRLAALLREADLCTEVLYGAEALVQVAALSEVDAVMAAIVGAAGLPPTLAAARAGKRVLLANKEALVMAGEVFMSEVRRAGALLLPIDSEHNAVFQSMPHGYTGDMLRGGVRRVLLTASGGPFRTTPLEQLATVTPEQAVAHPKVVDGPQDFGRFGNHDEQGAGSDRGALVVQRAGRPNRGGDTPAKRDPFLVDYEDGSVLAQLGNPDMRTPIAHAMAWPERIESGVAALDLFSVAQLNFERPDLQRFPCLDLAYRALRAEGNAAAVLNAANEVAVAAFLDRRLPFLGIADLIAATLDTVPQAAVPDLAAVLEADRQGRLAAREILAGMGVAAT